MGYLRPVIRTMLLLLGLAASGCASGDGASTVTTSHRADFGCPDATTTTTTTTSATTTASTGLPSVCELIDEIPADEIPAAGVRDYVVWSGTISGSIETETCDAVSQSGEVILVVFSDGSLTGAGETVAGAHQCNGVGVPEMTNRYDIDGRMTDVFTLTFSDGVQLVSEPIESGHTLVFQENGYGLVTISLVCESC